MVHWPQILILASMALSFALHCQKAGQIRRYNPVGYLIDAAVTGYILLQGGFFAVWGWTP